MLYSVHPFVHPISTPKAQKGGFVGFWFSLKKGGFGDGFWGCLSILAFCNGSNSVALQDN